MRIEVLDLIGEDCITMEDGQKVYDIVFPALKQNQKIELNFSGVEVFSSPFFNVAIGRLLKDFNRDSLNGLLSFKEITPEGLALLKLVIKNSTQYYSDEQYRKAHDTILSNPMEER